LDDLGIVSTITWFCREYQKHYPEIHVEKNIEIKEGEVPETLKIVIFRVLQEALNNIAKYVPAGKVLVQLLYQDTKIELSVQDDGAGFDIEQVLSRKGFSGGFGLTNMKERTELSGGTFFIESTIGKGTYLRAIWSTEG
jgi:signal transduction histidine kinase